MDGTSGWARTTGLGLRRAALLPLSYGRLGEGWQRRLDSNQGPQLQRLVSEATRLRRIWLPGAGAGRRTPTCRLEAGCSAPELHPLCWLAESRRNVPTATLQRSVSARSGGDSHRQRPPPRIQQCLKQSRSATWAWIVATELLGQLFGTPYDAVSALAPRLRREALASLARDLESTRRLHRAVSWRTSCAVDGTGRPGWARSTGLRLMKAPLYR